MGATFNEVFDILDKWEFFYGQRAGRELLQTQLKQVLQTVEWYESGDYSEDRLTKAVANYRMCANRNENMVEPEKEATMGWRPISEYNRDKYDWVLVKYFDGAYECVPEVAEMRIDGNWYNRTGALIDPDIFEVRYFFDMQQLDK